MDRLEMDMALLSVLSDIESEIRRLTAIRECINRGITIVPPEDAIELSITQLEKTQEELNRTLEKAGFGLRNLK